AGASTPEWIIKEVIRKMSDEIKSTESVENTEAEASFEEMLERSIKTLHTGEKVSGIIASITQTEVSVDLGTKQSGYIPITELSDEPNFNVNEHFKVGDEIEAFVTRVNDVEGTVALSKKRLDANKAWETISEARNERTTVEGTVIEENKGGVVVLVKGVRVFVPASLSGLPKDAPMTELLKKKVKLRITEVNQPRRRVVGSIRAVQFEERRAKAQEVWDNIEVGKHYDGVVKSLTSYGAFVDIGGVDGMVHVSELSWNRIHQPSEVVKVGDPLDVYVISFDKEARKISLGHRDPNANPWKVFTDKYSVGDVAEVKVVKLMTFGAFAEVVPGVDGLIHISQIANRRIGKPDEVLSEGQVVSAKITAIDNENKKVSLSIRALSEPAAPAAEPEEASEPENDEPAVVYDTANPPTAEELEAIVED
ncbi:MAG: 30S ribosomal protein S1, partial [Oscillospiraceae bacterium]|nr:30S ribosomal protein S1 [Oscillospiraceae bacterium]